MLRFKPRTQGESTGQRAGWRLAARNFQAGFEGRPTVRIAASALANGRSLREVRGAVLRHDAACPGRAGP
jgi:hypothetical protein